MTTLDAPRRPRPRAVPRSSGPHARTTRTARGTTATTSRAAARVAAWSSPVTSYYLIGGATLLLLALGLVMVLSSSTVYSLRDTDSPFTDFLNQAKFALIALPIAFGISRARVAWFRRLAWVGMVGSLGLQLLPVLIPSIRLSKGGNASWISIGGQSMQPSEFAKLGLAIWLGAVLASK